MMEVNMNLLAWILKRVSYMELYRKDGIYCAEVYFVASVEPKCYKDITLEWLLGMIERDLLPTLASTNKLKEDVNG
jgi:hypothetical protein